jgi:hypothetical protein
MPTPKRSLLPEPARKRMNPYGDTLDLAMERLGNIEANIAKALAIKMPEKARETNRRRKVILQGYVANSDSTGWHWQVPQGENYLLRRLSLVGDISGVYMVLIGDANARGLRELVNATTAVTFGDTSTGFAYSDAFNNDIYVRAGQDVYIQFSGSVNGHTIIVNLEVEEFVPVKRSVTEEENYAIQMEPVYDEADAPDSLPGMIDAHPVPNEHFTSPEEMEELADDDLLAGAAATGNGMPAQPLIPDVVKHLPPHLR